MTTSRRVLAKAVAPMAIFLCLLTSCASNTVPSSLSGRAVGATPGTTTNPNSANQKAGEAGVGLAAVNQGRQGAGAGIGGGSAPNGGTQGRAQGTSSTNEVGVPSFVKFTVPEDQSWGTQCVTASPHHGSTCVIPFHGVVYNSAPGKARIELGASENGSFGLIAHRILGVAQQRRNVLCVGRGCPYGGASLVWQPSPSAKTVTFRVLLVDSSGHTIVEGHSNTYTVV